MVNSFFDTVGAIVTAPVKLVGGAVDVTKNLGGAAIDLIKMPFTTAASFITGAFEGAGQWSGPMAWIGGIGGLIWGFMDKSKGENANPLARAVTMAAIGAAGGAAGGMVLGSTKALGTAVEGIQNVAGGIGNAATGAAQTVGNLMPPSSPSHPQGNPTQKM
jgi:phage-related protein